VGIWLPRRLRGTVLTLVGLAAALEGCGSGSVPQAAGHPGVSGTRSVLVGLPGRCLPAWLDSKARVATQPTSATATAAYFTMCYEVPIHRLR
jgi:hypothetical protein